MRGRKIATDCHCAMGHVLCNSCIWRMRKSKRYATFPRVERISGAGTASFALRITISPSAISPDRSPHQEPPDDCSRKPQGRPGNPNR
jgi:hypothetical protein